MQARIVEIIEILMQEIAQLSDPHGSDIEKLSRKLLAKGFSEGEVNQAIEIILSFINDPRVAPLHQKKESHPPSLRLLGEAEQSFFSKEAYGYLIHLQTMGILSPLQVEQVIESLILLGLSRVDFDDLKSVVSQVLIGRKPDNFDTEAVFSPGNDRIN